MILKIEVMGGVGWLWYVPTVVRTTLGDASTRAPRGAAAGTRDIYLFLACVNGIDKVFIYFKSFFQNVKRFIQNVFNKGPQLLATSPRLLIGFFIY